MYGTANNLSRGRHDCVFKDAERDALRSEMACSVLVPWVLFVQVVASSGEFGPVMEPLSRSASVRPQASRSGMCMAGPICGTFGLGSVWQGPFSLGNHLHGRRGRGFDAARWHMSWWVGFLCDKFGFVLAWSVFFGHHHRVGTEADQRGRGGMQCGELR